MLAVREVEDLLEGAVKVHRADGEVEDRIVTDVRRWYQVFCPECAWEETTRWEDLEYASRSALELAAAHTLGCGRILARESD